MMSWSLAFMAGFLVSLSHTKPLLLKQRQSNSSLPFDWSAIVPTSELRYHDCFEKFKCARLQVPLDWSSPNATGNTTVAIAIMTLPAKVPPSDLKFGGTIINNPGGPSESGTSFALTTAEQLRSTVDGDKHYEILSFDPRGVGETTPGLDCIGDESARSKDFITLFNIGPLEPGSQSFANRYAYNIAKSQLCERNLADILPHVSTASVARDMLEIVDKVEEERISANGTELSPTKGPPRLQFMGYSYGSILGMTFASMFPGRVGRLMIDGIADMDDYKNGTWLRLAKDSETALDLFYEQCFDVGSKLCPVLRPTDESPLDLKSRVDRALIELDRQPIYLQQTGSNYLNPLYSTLILRGQILTHLDTAVYRSPGLATLLDNLVKGNFSAYADLINTAPAPPGFYTYQIDARAAIACTDALPSASTRDLATFNAMLSELLLQSPTLAHSWIETSIACTGRKIRPRYSFDGPYTHPEPSTDLADNAPAVPLLFISATVDTRLPIANARKMVKRFPGARLLEIDTVGHCGSIKAPSRCATEHIRKYFDRGELPQEGLVCEADCHAFEASAECDAFIELASS